MVKNPGESVPIVAFRPWGTESEGPAGGHESSPCAHGELSWSAEAPSGGQECAPCAQGVQRAPRARCAPYAPRRHL